MAILLNKKRIAFLVLTFLVNVVIFSATARALDWTQESYDTSLWPCGEAELGYGEGDESTLVAPGRITYYFYSYFLVRDFEWGTPMFLNIKYDDAFVAYINGVEVARSSNMPPGPRTYSTLALSQHEAEGFESFNITSLITGNCLPASGYYKLNLSVEIHQVAPSDSDCSFDAEILVDGNVALPRGSMTLYFDQGFEPPISRSDPITVIQRPLLNIPAIVPRDDTLDIICGAPSSTTGWMAFLRSNYCVEMLPVSSAMYDSPTKRWFLKAPIPIDCPMDLYDLGVTADGVAPDTTLNSVKVVDSFKESFYFLHVTDSHVPERDLRDNIPAFREILREAAIINPEFIVHTGDLMDCSAKDQTELSQILLSETDVPVFVTPGNHDQGYGSKNWWKYFGWGYLDPQSPDNFGYYTPDYSFDYGDCHFTLPAALEHSAGFDTLQMDWINADLTAAGNAALKVMAYHCDFEDQLPEVFSTHGVNLALWGHTGFSTVQYIGNTLSISTQNSYDVPCHPGGIRLIRIENNAVASYPLLSNSQDITLRYSNPNDGTCSSNTAIITNTHNRAFENGLVKFLVPDRGSADSVTGGEVFQVVDAGSYLVYFVRVNIPAFACKLVYIDPFEYESVVEKLPAPSQIALSGSQPNPFNPSTRIHYEIFPEASPTATVILRIFDISGRPVRELLRIPQGAGSYYIDWDGKDTDGQDCSSGIYFAVLEALGQRKSAKLVLVR